MEASISLSKSRDSCQMIENLLKRFTEASTDHSKPIIVLSVLPLSIINSLHCVKNLFRIILLKLLAELNVRQISSDLDRISKEFFNDFSRFIAYLDCIDVHFDQDAILSSAATFLSPSAQDREKMKSLLTVVHSRLRLLSALLNSVDLNATHPPNLKPNPSPPSPSPSPSSPSLRPVAAAAAPPPLPPHFTPSSPSPLSASAFTPASPPMISLTPQPASSLSLLSTSSSAASLSGLTSAPPSPAAVSPSPSLPFRPSPASLSSVASPSRLLKSKAAAAPQSDAPATRHVSVDHPDFKEFVRLLFKEEPFLKGLSTNACLELALLWHPQITDSRTLLHMMLNMYNSSTNKLHQARLFFLLESWFHLFSLDRLPTDEFRERFCSSTENHLDSYAASQIRIRQSVLFIVQTVVSNVAVCPPEHLVLDHPPSPLLSAASPSLPQHRQRRLLRKSALTILTSFLDSLCWAHRHAISASDLFSYYPTAPRPHSLTAALNWSALISRWVTVEILLHTDLAARVAALECAILLIQKAVEAKNLELAVSIARGVNHPAVLRLGETFNALSSEILSIFQSNTSRFFPNGNIRSTPLSSSYPSRTFSPLQPLISALHRAYLNHPPTAQAENLASSMEQFRELFVLIQSYHRPLFILSFPPEAQAAQVSALRSLSSPEAVEIRNIITAYGLEGTEEHIQQLSSALGSHPSLNSLTFIPQLPSRTRSVYPYSDQLVKQLGTQQPSSMYTSNSRIQAKKNRQSVKTALSNWKATSTHAEIQNVIAAWAGVSVGQILP